MWWSVTAKAFWTFRCLVPWKDNDSWFSPLHFLQVEFQSMGYLLSPSGHFTLINRAMHSEDFHSLINNVFPLTYEHSLYNEAMVGDFHLSRTSPFQPCERRTCGCRSHWECHYYIVLSLIIESWKYIFFQLLLLFICQVISIQIDLKVKDLVWRPNSGFEFIFWSLVKNHDCWATAVLRSP